MSAAGQVKPSHYGNDEVWIACDHAGLDLKNQLMDLLPQIKWADLGTDTEASVDYPDYAQLLCSKIQEPKDRGVLICGSGIGMSIAANRNPGIRAALVENPVSARLSREHNDANVLCLGSRFLGAGYAAEIVHVWLTTSFSKEPRHEKRVKKLEGSSTR